MLIRPKGYTDSLPVPTDSVCVPDICQDMCETKLLCRLTIGPGVPGGNPDLVVEPALTQVNIR